MFVGVDVNDGESTYLDVYMEGTAPAWVAVGFTESPDMVRACVCCFQVYESLSSN